MQRTNWPNQKWINEIVLQESNEASVFILYLST